MDVYTVFEGLCDSIRTNLVYRGGLKKVTVLPYCPDAVTEPMVFVAEYDVEYDRTMRRGQDKISVTLRALVSRADDRSAGKAVADLFSGSGASSLKAAVEAGRGGPGEGAFPGTEFEDACDDFRVVRMAANRWFQHGDNTYLGGELTLEIIGSGD